MSDASRYITTKLSPRFIGSFKVKKKVSLWTYELEYERGISRGMWNAKDLKECVDVDTALVVKAQRESFTLKIEVLSYSAI